MFCYHSRMENASAAPLVSIIIPVYKVEEYLPRCLESILAQTYPHWEALCIDDGSPDRCGEILDAYAARDSRFRVLHQENGGVSAARNAGLDMMRGEYLTMVDADDSVEPEMLEMMVENACSENADMVACGYRQVSEDNSFFDSPPLWGGAECDSACGLSRSVLFNITSYNWTKLFRSDVWKDAAKIRYEGGAAFGEDHAVLLRYLMHAKRLAFINAPLYHYYRRGESASREFEQHLRPASMYARSFRMLAHTVDSLPHDTSRGTRGMWHYIVLRRFIRTVAALNLRAHPDFCTLEKVVAECRSHLMAGMTLKYLFIWHGRKYRAMVQRGKSALKKMLCRQR